MLAKEQQPAPTAKTLTLPERMLGYTEEKSAGIQFELEAKDVQLRQVQKQMVLVMMYLMKTDPDKKAEISRNPIEKGYVPRKCIVKGSAADCGYCET